jgi:hypothetical protein
LSGPTAAGNVAARMRAWKAMRTGRGAIDDLRAAVGALPRATRLAMLEGLQRDAIIAGAYASEEGICPMLAAHRAGGRTSMAAFADAWDRFALRSGPCHRGRPATERELLVLRSHLQASLLADEREDALPGAIAAHERLVRRRRPVAAGGPQRLDPRPRPGDPDRSRELRHRAGWAWTRLFRRYDDYARTLERLAESGAAREHTSV